MQTITAWQCISPEINKGFFKKCCKSTAVDGTDDDMLWNGREVGRNLRN